MVRIMRHICAFQALLGLQHARHLVLGLQASDTDRVISVDVSDTIGRFKNLQGMFLIIEEPTVVMANQTAIGTNTADTGTPFQLNHKETFDQPDDGRSITRQ